MVYHCHFKVFKIKKYRKSIKNGGGLGETEVLGFMLRALRKPLIIV